MPDYDPKSIPILDDIIEDKNSDSKILSEEISADIVDAENTQDDDTLDLFANKAAEFEADTAEPEIGTIEKFIDDIDEDAGTLETQGSETEVVESALIDYQLEEDRSEIDDSDVIDHQPEEQPASSIQTSDSDIPVDSILPIDLDAMVDDVVKQMMPDLEQQLRFLIHQALEEKLGNLNP